MSEEKNVIEKALGEVVIAPEVIEVIIGVAASKIKGVYGMQGNIASHIAEKLGRVSHGKGVDLKNNEDDTVTADLYVYLDYGVSVPRVAMAIQAKVKQQVLDMTGLELKEVNIHIVSVVPEKLIQPNLDDLFGEDELDD
ncbi:MAG: Asp23/Gls24 family envelope stress response protein [Streptococcaceae bacterium]|jgi:uncharacterized alkaline shock family protein YloU|nr:Asp23/Gls24 family envelope stress response protein [Streptococcaceae bacterium]